MRTLILTITALLYIIIPHAAFGEGSHIFNVKGYELNVKWKHKLTTENKDAFEIYGHVTKGALCKKLEIQVAFSSDDYKEHVPVARAYIENYQPGAKTEFRGEVPVETESEHLPSWGVIDYNVKCLE